MPGCSCVTLNHLLFSTSLPITTTTPSSRRSSSPSLKIYMSTRAVHKLVRGLRPPDAPPLELDGNSSGGSCFNSESITYKSRNALGYGSRFLLYSSTQTHYQSGFVGPGHIGCCYRSEGAAILVVVCEIWERCARKKAKAVKLYWYAEPTF